MEKQISIIIPTYNMEAYIGKCLDSLLIPEFDAVEVLVVNDGSKDRSSQIAHSYADRYPDSIRVIDKENGNYGSCINAALPLATGRYVKILDADDSFDRSEFSKLVRTLRHVNDDVLFTLYAMVDANDNIIWRESFDKLRLRENETYSWTNYAGELNNYRFQIHQIIYKTEIFKRFKYHQSEGISYSDTEWDAIPMIHTETYRFLPVCVTRYLNGREGQTMNQEQMQKSFGNFFTVFSNVVSEYSDIKDTPLGKFLFEQLYGMHWYIYHAAWELWNNKIAALVRSYDTELKEVAPEIYNKIDSIKYDKLSSYRLFHSIRKNNYQADYKIPFLVLATISVKSKLKAFKKSIFAK